MKVYQKSYFKTYPDLGMVICKIVGVTALFLRLVIPLQVTKNEMSLQSFVEQSWPPHAVLIPLTLMSTSYFKEFRTPSQFVVDIWG